MIGLYTFGQSPEKMNYQAVARDNAGNILSNQLISFRISILQTSSTGTSVYNETHQTTTNDFGLANLNIGNGSIVSGNFTSITWSVDLHFLKVEMDAAGGSAFQLMGTLQLLSVPYALHAKAADSLTKSMHSLSDADGDTKIYVEKNPNDDVIRFDMAGTEFFKMDSGRLEVLNTGHSVFIGNGAGVNDDLTDNFIVAIGDSALFNNSSGTYNTANGYSSLLHNTTGSFNTALGSGSLSLNNGGDYNVAVGNNALSENLYGSQNTAIGYNALLSNENGFQNTAIGEGALQNNITFDNTAIGFNSLTENTTGHFNTAIGSFALEMNTIGVLNTAIGANSLHNNTTGENNTSGGYSSLLKNVTGSNNTAFGYWSLRENISGYSNTAIGNKSLLANTSGYYNTASGYGSLFSNTIGYSNTAIGWQSTYNNISGNDNTAVGFKTLHSNTNGDRNTAIGFDALNKNSGGNDNTAIGRQALFNNTSGIQRTGLGNSTNSAGSTYSNNTGLGYNADCTASNQVRIGNSSVSSIGGYSNWSNISDLRFKNNIKEDVEGLSFIQKLRPVTYNIDLHAIDDFFAGHYNERDSSNYGGKYDREQIRYTGFIAQEVEAAAQELGYDFSGVDKPKNEDDFYGLRYAEFVVPLVKAVQELKQDLEEKDHRIEELESQLAANTALLNELINNKYRKK